MVCGLLNIMLARHFSLLIVCFVFVNCTPCHAHLWGFLCPIFVVACVRGHLIVIVCVINNTDGSSPSFRQVSCDCSIRVSRSLGIVLCLQVVIFSAAEEYPFGFSNSRNYDQENWE